VSKDIGRNRFLEETNFRLAHLLGIRKKERPMKKLVVLAVAAVISASGISAASAHHYKHRHHGIHSLNNPTPTRHDPPGTRTQCRGGCD
jgi:hypothetical protein